MRPFWVRSHSGYLPWKVLSGSLIRLQKGERTDLRKVEATLVLVFWGVKLPNYFNQKTRCGLIFELNQALGPLGSNRAEMAPAKVLK